MRIARLGLALLVLLGCQAQQPKVVLRVANWGGAPDDGEYYQTIRKLYEQFESENPGVQIQVEGIPGSQDYVTKVLLSHVARKAPDIITLDASSAAVFVEAGALRDLTPYIAADPTFNVEDYYPNVFKIAQRGDATYAVPMDFTPMVLYYNKKLFDVAGVSYPRPNWTFDDFLQTAKALTHGDQYGFAFANWMPGWIMWFWNAGGDVLASTPDGEHRASGVLDSPQNIKTLTWLRDLINVHQVAPNLSSTASQGVDPFLNGKAAMQVSGHWALIGYGQQKNIKIDDIGVAPLPTRLLASQTVMYQAGLAIGQYCKHPEVAWKFIRFMSSKMAQAEYHKTGVAISARKDVSKARATDAREAAFLDIVPSARAPWGSQVVGYDIVEELGQRMMDAVLKHGADPKAELEKTAVLVDKEIGRR